MSIPEIQLTQSEIEELSNGEVVIAQGVDGENRVRVCPVREPNKFDTLHMAIARALAMDQGVGYSHLTHSGDDTIVWYQIDSDHDPDLIVETVEKFSHGTYEGEENSNGDHTAGLRFSGELPIDTSEVVHALISQRSTESTVSIPVEEIESEVAERLPDDADDKTFDIATECVESEIWGVGHKVI